MHDLPPQLSAAPSRCSCEAAGCLLQKQLFSTGPKLSTAPVSNIPPVVILLQGQYSTQALCTTAPPQGACPPLIAHSLFLQTRYYKNRRKKPQTTKQISHKCFIYLFQMRAIRDIPLSLKNSQNQIPKNNTQEQTKQKTQKNLILPSHFTLSLHFLNETRTGSCNRTERQCKRP